MPIIVKETGLQALKRSKEGSFTVDRASETTRNLCDYCCQLDCLRRTDLTAMEIVGTVARVSSCVDYAAPLLYQNLTGICNGSNTLRLGPAWHKRLKKGDRVGLVNVSNNMVMGDAVVERIVCGPRDEIIDRHARKNHLFIDHNMTKKEAAAEMKKALPSLYGNMVYNNAKVAVAIYLTDVYTP